MKLSRNCFFTRFLLLFACFVLAFESSVCYVFASDTDSDDTDSVSLVGTFAEILGDESLSERAADILGSSIEDLSSALSSLVTSSCSAVSSLIIALDDGLDSIFDSVFDSAFLEDIMSLLSLNDDGSVILSSDMQEAVYNALLDYYCTLNGALYFLPTYSGIFDPIAGYEYEEISSSWLCCLTESPCYWVYSTSKTYFSGGVYPYTLVPYDSELSLVSVDRYYNGSYYDTQASSYSYFYSIGYGSDSSSYYIKGSGYLAGWYGSTILAYPSLEAAQGVISSDSSSFVNSSYDYSTEVVLSSSQLNYDYSTVVGDTYNLIITTLSNDDTTLYQYDINEIFNTVAFPESVDSSGSSSSGSCLWSEDDISNLLADVSEIKSLLAGLSVSSSSSSDVWTEEDVSNVLDYLSSIEQFLGDLDFSSDSSSDLITSYEEINSELASKLSDYSDSFSDSALDDLYANIDEVDQTSVITLIGTYENSIDFWMELLNEFIDNIGAFWSVIAVAFILSFVFFVIRMLPHD